MNRLTILITISLFSTGALAESPTKIILMPIDSIDIGNTVHKIGEVPCDDTHPKKSRAVVLDLSHVKFDLAPGVLSENSEWEVNGQRFVALHAPEGGEKVTPEVVLMEGEDGYVTLSARGRGSMQFGIRSLKGSFNGRKIEFKVPF